MLVVELVVAEEEEDEVVLEEEEEEEGLGLASTTVPLKYQALE